MRLILCSLIVATYLGAAAPAFKPVEDARLHNAHVVTDKLISGAQPKGDAGFDALAKLGVKTIISVDGAKPDLERARKHRMRYVHLPIGYDGVSSEVGRAIAKAIDELPGPIYIHCHHGKHRSAAALAVACVMNQSLRPEQAEAVLQTFGTGANYKGLWRDARNARPLDPAELRQLSVDFVEAAQTDSIVELMVGVDRHMEHLKQLQKSDWSPPADHPDLNPPHEALLLEEHLEETARLDETATQPEQYRTMLSESTLTVRSLREVLQSAPVDAAAADVRMKSVTASCTACHQSFRD
jgi:protein tyrosine phosphatase (PTP) superfamily phosphohydrolase (DUF442 family)